MKQTLKLLIFIVICLIILPLSALAGNLPKSNHKTNPIIIENIKPGTTNWELTNPATKREIEGYASLTSVNRGEEIKFFVNTKEPSYTMEIFRMGWYGGAGGRQMASAITTQKGIKQPRPIIDQASGLIECDWKEPYVLKIPNNKDDATQWASGVYLTKLTTSKTSKQSYIIFVVRDDSRPSDILFQSSVTTFQAYNNWGEMSLYRFNSRGKQASKVSFNRPYAGSPNAIGAYGIGAGEFLTKRGRTTGAGWEYNMLRWLERSGYDVTYATDIDTHNNLIDVRNDKPMLLLHKAFLTVGHDEYWSWDMRQNVEEARDSGVNLGFFSANTCYWQIRFEPSRISKDINRTIVSYKENFLLDPYARDKDPTNDYLITTLWRNKPVSQPEDALLGVMYETYDVNSDIVIDRKAPNWLLADTQLSQDENTAFWGIFSKSAVKEIRLVGLLGYEVDRMFSNAPPNTIRIARSPYKYKGGTRYSDMTVYKADSGATVFATGTMQWSWGLDDYNAGRLRPSFISPDAQAITRNVLARMLGN